MKKLYIKPEIKIIEIKNLFLVANSRTTQCDCETYRLYGGCIGCKGGCGCNTWDPDTEELVPGC